MDARSEKNLVGVHPDLAKVIRSASLVCVQKFIVIDGLRTPTEEAAEVAKGASQTQHSRHLPNAHGLACAVDVMALKEGLADWAALDYQPIAAAILQQSALMEVPVEWGGNWTTLKDWGHFQLPWAVYP